MPQRTACKIPLALSDNTTRLLAAIGAFIVWFVLTALLVAGINTGIDKAVAQIDPATLFFLFGLVPNASEVWGFSALVAGCTLFFAYVWNEHRLPACLQIKGELAYEKYL